VLLLLLLEREKKHNKQKPEMQSWLEGLKIFIQESPKTSNAGGAKQKVSKKISMGEDLVRRIL
jgi:hypothetical protein